MIYNLRKLQVLYAIDMCNQNNIYATSNIISNLICTSPTATAMCLTRYFDFKYVKRKRVPKVKGQVYSLTKKGMNALARYMERFIKGEHLNLKYKPEPVDFEIKELLPGLNKQESENEYIGKPLLCRKKQD